MGQTFSKSIIVLNFRLNRERIAATLCENRFIPQSCCKGSCFLNKQLEKEEEQQNSPYNNNGREKFEVVFLMEPSEDKGPAFVDIDFQHHTRYLEPVTKPCTGNIFHPPQPA